MRFTAIQMSIRDGAMDANRKNLSGLLDQAGESDLCLAPELWTTGYVQSRWEEIASNDSPQTIEWMAEQARRRGIWLGGSLIAKTDSGRLANRFVLFDRSGRLICKYDKAHLFVPLQEDIYLQAGAAMPPIVDVEGIKVAAAICYDLRFPEMFRTLAVAGAEVFLVPSEWPYPRQRALRVLAESRAIENQAMVLLANRVGPDSHGNVFCGRSGIFGPAGMTVEAGQSIGSVTFEIDIDELRALRSSFPVLKHRRRGIDHE